MICGYWACYEELLVKWDWAGWRKVPLGLCWLCREVEEAIEVVIWLCYAFLMLAGVAYFWKLSVLRAKLFLFW